MPSESELLKAYLADRDVPCPGCGYSLKGCASDTCPECGNEIRITVDQRVGRLGPFVIGLSGIMFGLGLYLPMFCYMLLRPMRSTSRMPGMRREEYVIISAVIALSVALMLWLANRRAIMRSTSTGATISAAALAAICGGSTIVFFAAIFL
jgi:hypothetical protein